jgi:hypothetical protein
MHKELPSTGGRVEKIQQIADISAQNSTLPAFLLIKAGKVELLQPRAQRRSHPIQPTHTIWIEPLASGSVEITWQKGQTLERFLVPQEYVYLE